MAYRIVMHHKNQISSIMRFVLGLGSKEVRNGTSGKNMEVVSLMPLRTLIRFRNETDYFLHIFGFVLGSWMGYI